MARVLIADDEDSMRSLVARAIAMDGHETVTAADGAEALDILTSDARAFDLLLTDRCRSWTALRWPSPSHAISPTLIHC